jgi:C1A family cysteine protease
MQVERFFFKKMIPAKSQKAYGKHIDGSRLFLYKTTRNLMHVTGDTGAWLRNVIPYPWPGEKAIWGHAIVAVGYDDGKKIKNTVCNRETTGALLIRNSWGTGWGDKGYGWLPYDYVLNKLAMDF